MVVHTGKGQDESEEEPVAEVIAKDNTKDEKAPKKDKRKTKKERAGVGSALSSFFGQFTFGLGTGLGATFYSHDLKGFGVYQPANGEGVYIFDQAYANLDTLPAVYLNWINDPVAIGGSMDTLQSPIITNGIPVFPNDIKFAYDSIKIGYKSTAYSIPLTATIAVDIDRYRIGAGFTFEFQKMSSFRPTALQDKLRKFKTNFSTASFKKYFGFVGITTFQSWQYKMVADLQFGKINRGKNFNKDLISSGIYFNIGYTVEKSYSEYFKLFIRPSVEWKSYSIQIPETPLQVNHRQPSLFLQFGATIRIPSPGRCPVYRCKVQINHVHDGLEYRSKAHPIWKWQNPNYGQNHPTLTHKKNKKKGK